MQTQLTGFDLVKDLPFKPSETFEPILYIDGEYTGETEFHAPSDGVNTILWVTRFNASIYITDPFLVNLIQVRIQNLDFETLYTDMYTRLVQTYGIMDFIRSAEFHVAAERSKGFIAGVRKNQSDLLTLLGLDAQNP